MFRIGKSQPKPSFATTGILGFGTPTQGLCSTSGGGGVYIFLEFKKKGLIPEEIKEHESDLSNSL